MPCDLFGLIHIRSAAMSGGLTRIVMEIAILGAIPVGTSVGNLDYYTV
jgi:hypothetical protein